jgi:Tol biopolymer transport system component
MTGTHWMLAGVLALGCCGGLGVGRAIAGPLQDPRGGSAVKAGAEPAVFAPGVISTADDESHPALTPDGRTLYFISTRPMAGSDRPQSNTDIWRMHATDDGWSEPERVTELASDGNEWFPTPSADGTLYFGSERREGNLGPEGTADLWRARRIGGHFGEPENLGATVNTPGNDIEAYVAPDESLLIFASNGRPDTVGAYDLYLTYNCDGAWTEPRHLDVNSAAWDFSPRVSPDGRRFLFTSNRGFSNAPLDRPLDYSQLTDRLHAPGNGLRDIYQVDVAELGIHRPCEDAKH